jgi:hypothetical protein
MSLSRNTLSQIAIGLTAIPFIVLWVLVAVWAWHQHSDSVRFASLQPYASELTLLPAPATLVGSYQTSESGSFNAGGPNYTLSIERDYTFKSSVSPQAVYDYYYWQLGPRGWVPDASQTNTPNNSSENEFTWQRAGTHSDTIFYTVTYYPNGSAPPAYGGGTVAPLELEIESDPTNTLNM